MGGNPGPLTGAGHDHRRVRGYPALANDTEGQGRFAATRQSVGPSTVAVFA